MAQTVLILVAILLVCMFIGAPVQASLGFTAFAGMMLFMGSDHIIRFGIVAYGQATSASQMVMPLFILMAEFLSKGGVADDIFDVISRVMRKIKGGLALATTLASTVFAALCGSSVATAATMGRISINQMIKKGYRPDFATGTVAAGGTLGIMIPPSLTFVLYGIITETSISKLLMAGLLPGIMISALFCISIIIRCRLNPELIGEPSRKERRQKAKAEAAEADRMQATGDGEAAAANVSEMSGGAAAATVTVTAPGDMDAGKMSVSKAILATVPAAILILVVLVSMYTGLATPSESAGFGAVGAFIIVIILRRFSFTMLKDTVANAVRTTCMMIFMAMMGLTLSYVISYLGIAQGLATFIINTGMSRWAVMIMLFILWFILGCLMDPGSMVVLTIPFIGPTLWELGFDPIWVGVVSTLMTEVGMITPPVGLNLFVLGNVSGVPLAKIIRGAIPYVIVMVIGLVLLCVFPQVALFLPSRM